MAFGPESVSTVKEELDQEGTFIGAGAEIADVAEILCAATAAKEDEVANVDVAVAEVAAAEVAAAAFGEITVTK
jgi:hypothetical protein